MAVAAPTFSYGKPITPVFGTSLSSQTLGGPAAGSQIFDASPTVKGAVSDYLGGGRADPNYPYSSGTSTSTGTPPGTPPGTTTFGGALSQLPLLQNMFGPQLTYQQLQQLGGQYAKNMLTAISAPYSAAMANAQRRAQQMYTDIQSASKAAAGTLAPLGQQTAGDYTNAFNQMIDAAKGYSGQLGQSATQAAQAQAGQFAAAGDTGRQPYNMGEQLGNTVYGLTGAIPSTPLAASGIAATTQARLLPANLQQAGQQEAYSALRAGNQQVIDLQNQLLAQAANVPSWVSQYISNYSQYHTGQIQNTLDMLKLAGGSLVGSARYGYAHFNPITGQVEVIPGIGAGAGASNIHTVKLGNSLYAVGYDKNGQIVAQPLVTGDGAGGTGTKLTFKTVGNTVLAYDPYTGNLVSRTTLPGTGKSKTILTHDSAGRGIYVTYGADGSISQKVAPGTLGEPRPPSASANQPPKTLQGPDGWTYAWQQNKDGTWTPQRMTSLGRKTPSGSNAAPKDPWIAPNGLAYIWKQTKSGWKLTPQPQLGQSTSGGNTGLSPSQTIDTIAKATSFKVPGTKQVTNSAGQTSTQVTSVSHFPDPYQQTLNTILGSNPNPTKQWVKRTTGLVYNSYAGAALKVAKALHRGGVDAQSRDVLTAMGTAQTQGPGGAYMTLITRGFPEDMAAEAVEREYGITPGQLQTRIEAAGTMGGTVQTVTPDQAKGQAQAAVSQKLGGILSSQDRNPLLWPFNAGNPFLYPFS